MSFPRIASSAARHPVRSRPLDALLRWLPFLLAALYSVVMASLAPDGHGPFALDTRLDAEALAFSAIKASHISACLVLGLLAVLAAGVRRWPWALMATVAVGACWELAQTTIVGRSARLSDLLPDAVGAALGCLLGAGLLWWAERVDRRRP